MQHGVGDDGHHQLHAQGAINGLDAHIREPAAGIDRREVGLELGAGHATAWGDSHGGIGSQLEPFAFGVTLQAGNHHFGDEHPWLLGRFGDRKGSGAGSSVLGGGCRSGGLGLLGGLGLINR